jgi:hypothetical protein
MRETYKVKAWMIPVVLSQLWKVFQWI